MLLAPFVLKTGFLGSEINSLRSQDCVAMRNISVGIHEIFIMLPFGLLINKSIFYPLFVL